MRDVFTRPLLYRTPEGRADVNLQFARARDYGLRNDPDLAVMQAFVIWQTARSRVGEWAAVQLCAEAVKSNGDFPLWPLAQSYLRNYLAFPLSKEALGSDPAYSESTKLKSWRTNSDLKAIYEDAIKRRESKSKLERANPALQGKVEIDDDFPLQHIVAYNDAVRQLYGLALPAYVNMMEEVAGCTSAPKDCASVSNAADTVIKAWGDFSKSIMDGRSAVPGTGVSLSLLAMNDGTYLRAYQYRKATVAGAQPPALALAALPLGGVSPGDPPLPSIRVNWRTTFTPLLGSPKSDMLDAFDQEQAAIFDKSQQDLLKFETDLLSWLKRGDQSVIKASLKSGVDAATEAAELGLFKAQACPDSLPCEYSNTLLPSRSVCCVGQPGHA